MSITRRGTAVKPFRVTARKPGRFGAGLLAGWRGQHSRAEHTSQDERWAAQCFSHAAVWREAQVEAGLAEREQQVMWDSQFVG